MMTIFALQNGPDGAATTRKKALALGFYAVTLSTKDTGRVVLGGGFAGVPENNNDKMRANPPCGYSSGANPSIESGAG